MKTKTRYELYKDWVLENKEKILYGISCLLIFFVGFGTGKVEKYYTGNKMQSNYTTNKSNKQIEILGEADNTKAKNDTNNANATQSCIIKGTSSKIYHLPGGAFYDRVTKPAACFNSEDEAVTAGYRKSSR
jgi:hypothetical protein